MADITHLSAETTRVDQEGEPITAADYPYLMPWDRRTAAERAFSGWFQREPATDQDRGWISGYIACIEDLPNE